jgi:hypothetical protein
MDIIFAARNQCKPHMFLNLNGLSVHSHAHERVCIMPPRSPDHPGARLQTQALVSGSQFAVRGPKTERRDPQETIFGCRLHAAPGIQSGPDAEPAVSNAYWIANAFGSNV